ncbi:CTP-dependent riboflavin kinase [Candidatus Thorarchaeota archaeon]|nr:MAG: CTP-dependent riboflavin kinase [Candidatus Thorarchaeota archaeon]
MKREKRREMATPEIWFTLYELAKRGAVHRHCEITTGELGNALDVSQQTASRRIRNSVEDGLVERVHTASGMMLKLTEQGKRELLNVLNDLEVSFAPPGDEIEIVGTAVSGIGEGAYYVDVYSERFKEALGFEPFSGTLNVKVSDEQSQTAVKRMKHSPPIIVPGFSREERTFGDVICYRVRINDAVEGAVVIAQRTHHSRDILEVIAPFNLREKLDIKDNERVKLTVVPLHLAT